MARLAELSTRTSEREQVREAKELGRDHRWIVSVYFVLALIALIALSVYIHGNPLPPFDLAASHLVQSVHAGWYDFLMRIVGDPGYPPQVYALVFWIIIVLYLTGLKWEAVAELFATVGIGAVGLLIKTLVNRPRPTPNLVNVITVLDKGKLSYPAGHVESFVAILGFLWFLSFVLCKNPWVRFISLFVFGEMLALIGISRVYTGEHWLTDSIAGYLFGSLWLILTIYLYEWGKGRFFVQETKPSRSRRPRGFEKSGRKST